MNLNKIWVLRIGLLFILFIFGPPLLFADNCSAPSDCFPTLGAAAAAAAAAGALTGAAAAGALAGGTEGSTAGAAKGLATRNAMGRGVPGSPFPPNTPTIRAPLPSDYGGEGREGTEGTEDGAEGAFDLKESLEKAERDAEWPSRDDIEPPIVD